VVPSGVSCAAAILAHALKRVAPKRQLAMIFIDVTLLGSKKK
jgi:hypothetical protein